MKRVGNKSGQLVRSASRRRKTASRFQFDVTIDKVFGVKPGATYLVKWTRGVKVAQTKPHPATKEAATKAGLAVNEKLSLLVTLYREDNRKFDAKDSKISLVSVSPKKQERTIAKIHFDLSQFAGVPHASSTKVFKLSEKVSIRATVESRFLKSGAAGSGSAGASSALSGVSARSSDDDDIEDEFGDLALEDIPELDSVSKTRATPIAPNHVSNGPSPRVPLIVETPSSASSLSTERAKPPSSTLSSSIITSGESPPVRAPRSRPSPVTSTDVKALPNTENTSQLTSIRKENEKLAADLLRYKKERSSVEESYKQQVEQLHSQIDEQSSKKRSMEEDRTRSIASIAELRENNRKLESKVKIQEKELSEVKQKRDELSVQCKKLGAAEQKCKHLSQEVDRLVVLAARPRGESQDEPHSSEIEKRMDALREERDRFERKVRSHETHAAKTKSAYQKLTEMYNSIREQHVALVQEMEDLKKKKSTEPRSAQALPIGEQDTDLRSQLEEARQEIQDVKASKQSLQSDYDHLLSQTDSVQERFEHVSRELEEVRRNNDELHAETEELKGQRDVAMQRALSRGKSGSSNVESARSIGRVEEELRLTKDKLEREHGRLTKRNAELESEIGDLKDDIEYEKSEKAKAREERDKIRESARALERRTSLAAKQNDAMQSMRRQLSTHQMREQDRESTIASLRSEITTLRSEVQETKNGSSLVKSSSRDNIGEVLQDLVSTKVALALAEDEKLNLQFAMKILKKSEKATQEKLAAHASRLEVKLGQANEELERLRRSRGLEDATEFNDLGSDVDY